MLKLGKRITDERSREFEQRKKVLNLSHLTDEQHEMGVRNWRKGETQKTGERKMNAEERFRK